MNYMRSRKLCVSCEIERLRSWVPDPFPHPTDLPSTALLKEGGSRELSHSVPPMQLGPSEGAALLVDDEDVSLKLLWKVYGVRASQEMCCLHWLFSNSMLSLKCLDTIETELCEQYLFESLTFIHILAQTKQNQLIWLQHIFHTTTL